MEEKPDGDYILYSDYAALKAEVERQRDILDRIDITLGKRPDGHRDEITTLLQEWRDGDR